MSTETPNLDDLFKLRPRGYVALIGGPEIDAAAAELSALKAKAALADEMARDVLMYQADDVAREDLAAWLARYTALGGGKETA